MDKLKPKFVFPGFRDIIQLFIIGIFIFIMFIKVFNNEFLRDGILFYFSFLFSGVYIFYLILTLFYSPKRKTSVERFIENGYALYKEGRGNRVVYIKSINNEYENGLSIARINQSKDSVEVSFISTEDALIYNEMIKKL